MKQTSVKMRFFYATVSKRRILDKSLDKNVLSILHQIKHYSNQKYEIAIKKWRAILSYSKELRDTQTVSKISLPLPALVMFV